MGIGDEIIASGHALAEHRRTGRRVRILDRHGIPRWHELWDGLDFIETHSGPNPDLVEIHNGPGCRPYIAYPFTRQSGCTYSGWRCRDNVGVITLTEAERLAAERATIWLGRFVVIEPNLADTSNPNKQWGRDRWQGLVQARPDLTWVQVGPEGTSLLHGTRHVVTRTFREAVAVLERAHTAVLPEGALHHAAAAIGKPVVVLYGGAVDESAMGYDGQFPVTDNGPGSPCGAWLPCPHCAAVWATLSVDRVDTVLDQALRA